MEVVVVTPAHQTQALLELLNREFRPLKKKGIRLSCGRRASGLVCCRVVESRLFGRRDRASFRHAVSRAVAGLIIQEWAYFVGHRLFSGAAWLNDRDWNLVRSHIDADHSPLSGYRDQVAGRLAAYLEECAVLDVAGFVNFRLPDYLEVVGEFAGRILDDALLEQENREFIDVLKQFTQRQEQRLDTVHVVILSGNRFRIYDGKMRIVTKNMAMAEGPLGTEDEVRQEDLLIAALVTLAPRRVTIHGDCTSATYNTLAEVFPGALHRCNGCEYCPTSHQA